MCLIRTHSHTKRLLFGNKSARLPLILLEFEYSIIQALSIRHSKLGHSHSFSCDSFSVFVHSHFSLSLVQLPQSFFCPKLDQFLLLCGSSSTSSAAMLHENPHSFTSWMCTFHSAVTLRLIHMNNKISREWNITTECVCVCGRMQIQSRFIFVRKIRRRRRRRRKNRHSHSIDSHTQTHTVLKLSRNSLIRPNILTYGLAKISGTKLFKRPVLFYFDSFAPYFKHWDLFKADDEDDDDDGEWTREGEKKKLILLPSLKKLPLVYGFTVLLNAVVSVFAKYRFTKPNSINTHTFSHSRSLSLVRQLLHRNDDTNKEICLNPLNLIYLLN